MMCYYSLRVGKTYYYLFILHYLVMNSSTKIPLQSLLILCEVVVTHRCIATVFLSSRCLLKIYCQSS